MPFDIATVIHDPYVNPRDLAQKGLASYATTLWFEKVRSGIHLMSLLAAPFPREKAAAIIPSD